MYLTQLIKVHLLRLYETLKVTQLSTGYCVIKGGKEYGITGLLVEIECFVLLYPNLQRVKMQTTLFEIMYFYFC